MPKNDYYEILGVAENASKSDIKKAYRELAKKYHPDKAAGNKQHEEMFKKVSEAYAVLNDDKKRSQYDQMRRMGVNGNFNGQNINFDDLGSIFSNMGGTRATNFGGLGDILGQFFGGDTSGFQHAGRRPAKGQDIQANITVPFDVAIRGGNQYVSVNNKTLSIKIPPATQDGKVIRLRGQGHPGYQGAAAGDLLIRIQVAPHPDFSRKGHDLYSTIHINIVQAILGSKVKVKTYEKGTIELNIPAGTEQGKYFKLTGFGVKADNIAGDHYVQVHIDIPKNLNGKSKQALLEFAKSAGLKT